MPTNVIFKVRDLRVPSLAYLDDRLLADIGAGRDGLPAQRPQPSREASGLARFVDLLMRPLTRAMTAL